MKFMYRDDRPGWKSINSTRPAMNEMMYESIKRQMADGKKLSEVEFVFRAA